MDINIGSKSNSSSGNIDLNPQSGLNSQSQFQTSSPSIKPQQTPVQSHSTGSHNNSPVGVVSLNKGAKVSISKTDPSLDEMMVGLGWDVNNYQGQYSFDLDVMVFMLTSNGKVKDETGVIFYNNPRSSNGAVVHNGDNRTGAGDGDDEKVMVHLSQIPSDITKLVFTVSIFEASIRKQNFGQVSNAFIRLVNKRTNQEIIRYDLSEEYSIETALVIGELYRYNNEWKFSAVGSGWTADIAALFANYGLQVS